MSNLGGRYSLSMIQIQRADCNLEQEKHKNLGQRHKEKEKSLITNRGES